MIQIPQTTLDFKNHQVKMKYEEEDLKKCSPPCAAILATFSRSGREKKYSTYKLIISHHQVVTFCNLAVPYWHISNTPAPSSERVVRA